MVTFIAVSMALLTFGVPIFLLVLSLVVGKLMELDHLKQLDEREATFRHIRVSNLKTFDEATAIAGARFVEGQAVIGTGAYKSLLVTLRKLIGGEMAGLELVLRRARREALLRLLQQAHALGATEVHNVRFETSTVATGGVQDGNNRNALLCAEIYATGTAILRA